MIRFLIRWLQSFSRRHRERLRQFDANNLWPAIWSKSGKDVARFILAASWHTANDPIWADHVPEWQGSPIDPGVWAARRLKETP